MNLVFDADDTLWENNILFERVVDDFVTWMAHPSLDEATIRAVVRDIEAANVVAHGYGSRVFLRTLRECFERLRARPATDRERRAIEDLATDLVEHKIELVPDVAETLRDLGIRHRLFLLTKGDPDEQQAKVDASGLAKHFTAVHIVAEKRVETYLELARHHGLAPEETWMIGNSPRFDILPARRAGWNAVYIPNTNTWALEIDELEPDDRILVLATFTDLRQRF